MIIELPSCANWLVTYAFTPCVRTRAAITAATPIKMPSAVKNERVRFAHSASKALPILALNSLPGTDWRRRNSLSKLCNDCTGASGVVGGPASIKGDVGWFSSGGGFLMSFPPSAPCFQQQIEL